MDQKTAGIIIAGVCVLLLFILAARKRAQFLLHFVVRTVLGAVAIAFCNQMLESERIAVVVGINPVTLLTAGTLGISGVALLYGIVFTKYL